MPQTWQKDRVGAYKFDTLQTLASNDPLIPDWRQLSEAVSSARGWCHGVALRGLLLARKRPQRLTAMRFPASLIISCRRRVTRPHLVQVAAG